MFEKRNRRNNGVKGPLNIQFLMGWNTISVQPYEYLSSDLVSRASGHKAQGQPTFPIAKSHRRWSRKHLREIHCCGSWLCGRSCPQLEAEELCRNPPTHGPQTNMQHIHPDRRRLPTERLANVGRHCDLQKVGLLRYQH